MANSPPLLILSSLLLLLFLLALTPGQLQAHQLDETGLKLMSDALEWPTTMSLFNDLENEGDLDEDESVEGFERRSLFWRRIRYYISYGALAANRIPCPPRSGRSYYTHNCYKARGPAHPYTRGCSAITRCRR